MGLEVIGAGLGRTGTLTLKLALEQLGFGPCHHMVEVLANPQQIGFWRRAAGGEAMEWNDVFRSYRASVDWPSCHFYAELAERYPDAKVILSTRDPERWYESMEETILKAMAGIDAATVEDADAHPMRFAQILICEKTFGRDYSRENAIATFERHVRAVIDTIPAERLLVFEAAQGWAPLCDFLGVAQPETPFPRVNSREEFWTHAEAAV